MTETSTQIEPYVERGRIALKENKGLKGVQEAIVEPYHADVTRTEMVPFPDVPAPVVLTDEVKEALLRLKDVFAVVQPETRRTLTDEEKTAVYEEQEVLKAIADLIETRTEGLKEIVRMHMDVDAEERNVAVPQAQVDPETHKVIVAATDRDKAGHYILCAPQNPERSSIPGTNQEWSREFRKGSMSTDASVLEDLHEEGEISHEVYLAMTKERRVFDETKAYSTALDKPALRDDIIKAIKAMTSIGKPSVSLFTRKAK